MAIRVNVRQQGLEASIRKATRNVNRRGLSVNINDKSFTRPLGKITGSVSEFNKSLEASNARVLAFGASVGIIQGVQRAFAGLVKATVQVEKALMEVNVVMGATDDQLQKFGKGLFDVARNTAQSFSTVATAATELARQGLSMEETLKRTNDALILTRLTGMGAEQAVSGLTAAINTFNKAGLDSTKIISKMAAVDVQFAVSTEDLVDGIARAGAVAQDAGVSFDQLLGAVTAAQQQTARGGKVIGNSFKTIFTRVQRGSTIKRLEELGIAVRDVAGNTLPAITVLSNLAKTYDKLTDTTKAAVAEQVGGVFQINILKAAIKDLANENSVLARATRTAAQATDEAYKKNELLNRTLSALTAQTASSIQELAAAIGKIGLEDSLKRWVSVVKDFADVLNKGLGDGEETGHNWGKGIIKGLGNVLTGPVMLAAFAVLGSLLKKTTVFLFNSVREMIGITSQAEKHRKIQASIVTLLAENGALQTKLLALEGNRAGQERIILGILQAQSREKARMAAMAAGIAPAISRGGFGTNLQRRPGRSQGHIPNYASTKDRNIEKAGARAGGYAPGAVKEMNMPGQGRVIYNSAETIKYFGGMVQPAIMPPKRSSAGRNYNKAFKRTHGFDPYANMGYVPNFARSPYMAQSVGYKPKHRGSKVSKEMDMGEYIRSMLKNAGASGIHTNIQAPPSMGRRNREGKFIAGKTLPFWGGPQATWQEMWKGYQRFGLKQDPTRILRPVFGKSKGGGTAVKDLPENMQSTALEVMRAQAEMAGKSARHISRGTIMSGRAEAVLQKMFLLNRQSVGQRQSLPSFPASTGLIPNYAMGNFRQRVISSSPYVQARAGLKNDIQEKAVNNLHHFISRRDNTGRGASGIGEMLQFRGRPAPKSLFNDLDMYQAAVVTKGGKIHVGHGHDEIRDMLFRQKVSLSDARDLVLDWTTVGHAREAQRAVSTKRRNSADSAKLERELKKGQDGLTAAEMREIAMGGTVTPRRPSSGGHVPNYAGRRQPGIEKHFTSPESKYINWMRYATKSPNSSYGVSGLGYSKAKANEAWRNPWLFKDGSLKNRLAEGTNIGHPGVSPWKLPQSREDYLSGINRSSSSNWGMGPGKASTWKPRTKEDLGFDAKGHVPNYARGRFSKFLGKSKDFINENAWPVAGIGAAWNTLPPIPAAIATSSIMAVHALASGAKHDAALRGKMALEKLIEQGRSGNIGRGRGATRIKHLPEIWQKEALRGGGAHRTMGSMVPRDIMKRLGMSGGLIPNFARGAPGKMWHATFNENLANIQKHGLRSSPGALGGQGYDMKAGLHGSLKELNKAGLLTPIQKKELEFLDKQFGGWLYGWGSKGEAHKFAFNQNWKMAQGRGLNPMESNLTSVVSFMSKSKGAKWSPDDRDPTYVNAWRTQGNVPAGNITGTSPVSMDAIRKFNASQMSAGGHVPNYARYTGKKTRQQALAAAQKSQGVGQARIRSGDHTRTIGMSELDAIIRDGKFKSIKYNPLDPNLPQETILSAARSGVHRYKKGKGPPRNTKTYAVEIPQLGITVGPGQHYPSWNAFDLATGSRVIHSSASGAGSKGYRRLQLDRVDSIVAGKEHLKVDPKMAAMGMIPNYALWQHEKDLGKNLQANLAGLDLSTQAGQLKALRYMDGAGLQRLLSTWQGSISKTGGFDGWRGSYPSMPIKDRSSLLGGSLTGGIYDKGSPLSSKKTMDRIFNSPGAAKEFFAYLTGAKNGMDISRFLSPQEKDYFKQKYGSVPQLKHIEDMGANGTKASRLSILREDFFSDPKVKASLPRNIASIQASDKRQQAIVGENKKLNPLLKVISEANANRRYKNLPNVLMAGYDAEMKGTPRGGMPPINAAQAAAITAAMAQGGVVGPSTRPYSADYGLHKRNDARAKFLRETNIRERLAKAGHNVNLGPSGFQLGASNIQGAYPGRRVSGFLDVSSEAHEKRIAYGQAQKTQAAVDKIVSDFEKQYTKDQRSASKRFKQGGVGKGRRIRGPRGSIYSNVWKAQGIQGIRMGQHKSGGRSSSIDEAHAAAFSKINATRLIKGPPGLPSLRDLLMTPNQNPLRMLTKDLLQRAPLDMGPFSMARWRDWRKDPFMSDPRNPRGAHSRHGSYLRGGEGYGSGGHVPNFASLSSLVSRHNLKKRGGTGSQLAVREPPTPTHVAGHAGKNPLTDSYIKAYKRGDISEAELFEMIKGQAKMLRGSPKKFQDQMDYVAMSIKSAPGHIRRKNIQSMRSGAVNASGGHVPNYGLFGPGVENVIKASPSSVGAVVDSIKRESSLGLTPKVVTAPGLKSSTNPGLAVVNQEQEGGKLSNARKLHGRLNPKQGASKGHVPNYAPITPPRAEQLQQSIHTADAAVRNWASNMQATTSVFRLLQGATQQQIAAFDQMRASAQQAARAAREGIIRSRADAGKQQFGRDRRFASSLFRADRANELASSDSRLGLKHGALIRSMSEDGRFSEGQMQAQRAMAMTVAQRTGDHSTLNAINNLNKELNKFAQQSMNPAATDRRTARETGQAIGKQINQNTRVQARMDQIKGADGKFRSFDNNMARRLMVRGFLQSQGHSVEGAKTPAMMAMAQGTPQSRAAFDKYMGKQGVVHSNAAMARAGFMAGDFGTQKGQINLRGASRLNFGRHMRLMQRATGRGEKREAAAQRRILERMAARDTRSVAEQQRLMAGIAAGRDASKNEQASRDKRARELRSGRRAKESMARGETVKSAWQAGRAGEKQGATGRERVANWAARKGMPAVQGMGGFMKPGSMMGMGLSFVLPMLAGMLEPQVPRTKRGKYNKETGVFDVENAGSVLGMHSDRAGSVLMGAGMGAIFGLPGMIAGAAMGWVAGTKKMTLTLEELAKIQEEGNSKLAQNLQAGDKIQGMLISRGKMAASGDTMGMDKANSQINMLLSQITDPEMQAALSRNAGSLKGFQKVMGEYSDKLSRGSAVTNFISASKSGNVGTAGASLGVIFDNAISNGSQAQVIAIEAAFDRVDKKMEQLMSSQGTAPEAFLNDLRTGAAGGMMSNLDSREAISMGVLFAAAAATIAAAVAGVFTKGATWAAIPGIVGWAGAAGAVGAGIGASMEAGEKQELLKSFRSQNAGAYDFMEEFHNIGVLTDDEYKRLTAAFERGSLTAYELVGEVERSIENLKKTRDQGNILAGKTFQLEKTFKSINRDLAFDLEIGKTRAQSDQKLRESTISFGQQFQTRRGIYDKARYGTEKRVTSRMLAENDSISLFDKAERKEMIKFVKENLSKMNVPIDVQQSLVKEFGTKALPPGMTSPYEMLENYWQGNEFDVNRKITDSDTSADNRKTILATIGKIVALQKPQARGNATDLSAVFDELNSLVGTTDNDAFESLVKGYLPKGTQLDVGGGNGPSRFITGTSPYKLSDLGLKNRQGGGNFLFDQDLDSKGKLQQTRARKFTAGAGGAPGTLLTAAATGRLPEYNPDIEYSKPFGTEESIVLKDMIDALKQRRQIFYEQISVERKALILKEKQNLIVAQISSKLMQQKKSFATQIHTEKIDLMDQRSISEQKLMGLQAFKGSSYAYADPEAESERQLELSRQTNDERYKQREREAVFQAKQNLAKLLSEKKVVTALDNLGDRIDALLAPLTIGTTATTKAFNAQAGFAQNVTFRSANLGGGQGHRQHTGVSGLGVAQRNVQGISTIGGGGLNMVAQKSLATSLNLPPAAAAQVTTLQQDMQSRRIAQQDQVAEMRALENEQMRLLERRSAMEQQVMRKFEAAQVHIGREQTVQGPYENSPGTTRPADEDLNKWKEFTKKYGAEKGLKEFAKWKGAKGTPHGGAWQGDDPWGRYGSMESGSRILVSPDGDEKQVSAERWIMNALKLDKSSDGKFKTEGRGLGVILPWNYGTEEEDKGALDIGDSMEPGIEPKDIGFKGMQLFQPQWALAADFDKDIAGDKLAEMNREIARALAEDIKAIWESLNQLKDAEKDLYDSTGSLGVLKYTKTINGLKKAIAADGQRLATDQKRLNAILAAHKAKNKGSTNQEVIQEIEDGIAGLDLNDAANLFKNVIDLDSAGKIKKKIDSKIIELRKDAGGGADSTVVETFVAASRELELVMKNLSDELLGNATKDMLMKREAVLAHDKFLRGTRQPLGSLSVLTSNYGLKNPDATTSMQLSSFGELAAPIMQQRDIKGNSLLSRSARSSADIAALTGIRVKGTDDLLGQGEIIEATAVMNKLWNEQLDKEVELTNETDAGKKVILAEEIDELKKAFKEYIDQFEKAGPRQQGIFQEFKAFGTGLKGGLAAVQDEADNIYVTLGQNLPMAFRDGMVNAMTIALEKAEKMSDKFRAIGIGFLQMIQQAVLKSAASRVMGLFGFAEGGPVYGGSGTRDDVPAMLMGGEYVMRKSAVEKYGPDFMKTLNAGHYAEGGPVRKKGGGFNLNIKRPRAREREEHVDESDFGDITTYEVTRKERGISRHLSPWARENDPSVQKFFSDNRKMFEEDRQTEEQRKDRKKAEAEYKTQERRALQGAIAGIVGGVAMGWLAKKITKKAKGWAADKRLKRKIDRGGRFTTKGEDLRHTGMSKDDRKTYRDFVKRGTAESPALGKRFLNDGMSYRRRDANGQWKTYNTGPIKGTIYGSDQGDYDVELNRGGHVPAMLTGGEYVIGRESVQKYGPQVMSSINEGHFSGFNQGGHVGAAASSTTNDNTKNDVNITVNVAEGGAVSENVSASGGGGIGNPQEFGKRIKAAVLDVIQQQKRVGGMLR